MSTRMPAQNAHTEVLAPTGHVVGATYRSRYWGGTYRVIGATSDGVEVECVELGGGCHQPGERWTHCTALDKRDTRLA